MIFTSFEYLGFFAFVLGVRSFLQSHAREKWMLLFASYTFYMSWSIACGGLILFTSVVDYSVGRWLGRTTSAARRKGLLVASLVVNLGVLAFFKYSNFIYDNAWAVLRFLNLPIPRGDFDVILPVGISFFTFQSMSYTVDVYRRQLAPCTSLKDFLLFVSFFPQLVAGPIVRAADFLPQLKDRVRVSALDIEIGCAQFLIGAVKKTVISDQVSNHVDLIFANPGGYDGLSLLQGLLGYAVQIYCDFSGYSDMAIGSARIMGFRFMENFQMPYSAVTITEFWRRWHISLSSWLRDYLYIPLGGNRLGVVRTYVNLLVTMLLGGLWHGASWNFIAWGALHGVGLGVHKAFANSQVADALNRRNHLKRAWSFVSRLLTLGLVLLGWVFFRAQTWGDALDYLQRLVSFTGEGTRMVSPYIIPAVLSVALVHFCVDKDRNWAQEIAVKGMGTRIVAYASLLTILVCLGATDSAPFIYFQF